MKKFLATLLALFLFPISFSVTGCGGNSYKHLTQEEAMKMIAENPDAIILDVRSRDEYEKKHIPNALLVPIDHLRIEKFDALPDKNQMILIYCWTGRRAEDAAKILADHGYKNVYEFGGLVDWTGAVEGTEL